MSDRDLRNLYENVRRGDEYVAPRRENELYTEVLGTVTDPYAEPQSNEIPERNVPLAELIKKLRDLGNRGLIDQEDINFFNKTLTTKPFKSKIIKHLNTHNISSDTLQTKDVVEAIITLLSNYKSVETYSQYIDKIKNLSNFPQVGNIVKQFSDIFPKEFITDLINLDGMEGGRGVGKGEIACSALFGDVSQGPPGAGDLVWNGEYLEVKGSAARLGGRDDSIDPRSYRFGQLMAMHQIQHETEIAKLIQTIWKKTPAKEQQLFLSVAQRQDGFLEILGCKCECFLHVVVRMFSKETGDAFAAFDCILAKITIMPFVTCEYHTTSTMTHS